MAKTTTVGVTLKDRMNQSGTLSFSYERGWLAALADFFGWTSAKADALADFVETYSNALVVRSGVNQANTYDMPNGFIGGPDIEKGFDLCDQKAVLIFRDTDSGASHTISLPAPKANMFVSVLGEGLRVAPGIGEDMATDLSPVLDLTLVFEQGWLIGKK